MDATPVDSQNKEHRHIKPVGFESVPQNDNYKGPTQERASSSKSQLWLIKVPHNFDPQNLSGKNVVFNSTYDVPSDSENNSDNRRYQILQKACAGSELSSFRVLLPSSKRKEICPAKPFSGQLSVVQKVSLPALYDPPSPPPAQHERQLEVKCRWKPFGCKEPRKRNVQESVNLSHSHEKKRKRLNEPGRIFEEKDTNSSTTVSPETKSPRKKRKDRQDKEVKVKQESPDFDEDSITRNQKAKVKKSGCGDVLQVKTERLSDEETTRGKKEKRKHKSKKLLTDLCV